MGRFERDGKPRGHSPHECCGRAHAIVLALVAVCLLGAASPASPPPAPATAPSPAAQGPHPGVATPVPAKPAAPAAKFPGGHEVIDFLSETIGWYRHLAVEEQIVSEPAETLIVADDRQMADEALALSFEYARAEAALLAKLSREGVAPPPAAQPKAPAASVGSEQLAQKAAQAEADLKVRQSEIDALQSQLTTTTGKFRRLLLSQITTAQGELDLARARAEAFRSILAFEGGSGHPERGTSALLAQIDELQKSVPETGRAPKVAGAVTPAPVSSGGIIGLAESLLALNRKLAVLEHTSDLTSALAGAGDKLRAPLIAEIRDIDRRGDELAQQSVTATDAGALRQRQKDFQALIERHKLTVAAAVPLRKQAMILGLYKANLERWHGMAEHQGTATLRRLIVRLAALGLVLAAVFGAAALWRHFAFRYVQDVYRRHQFLQARRIVLAVVIALVLLFNFATEIGTIATIMGFAAAGIALALQNVILSVAGYFFLIGKFGIKAGDRVQVTGVTGDVIEVGLVKLSLMEVSDGEDGRHPTGRVAVFSNAVVFQPSGNFFKQVPGTSFVWIETSFTLAPDCDYRLAEKRLMEAVDEVFTRYREGIYRQHLHMEKTLNLSFEAPRPESRLQLDQSGLRVVIRYPAEMHRTAQTADEVSRRLLDAIRGEPTLKLVSQAAPNIQAAAPSPPGDGTAPSK